MPYAIVSVPTSHSATSSRRTLREHRLRSDERVGLPHLEALQLEVHAAQQPDRGIVLDHQHRRLRSLHWVRQHSGMIVSLNPTTGPGATKRYATAIAGLWRSLAGAAWRELAL